MLQNRLRRRLLHHALLAFGSIGLTLMFIYLFPKRDLISRLSIATAYAALFLTAGALLLGRLNVVSRRPNPVSFDLRRDLGIWAGIAALVHTLVGLNVHLRGKMWLYFFDTHHHLRRDTFGLGNYTGGVATIVFLLLLALSNDVSPSQARNRALEITSALGIRRGRPHRRARNRISARREAHHRVPNTFLRSIGNFIGFPSRWQP